MSDADVLQDEKPSDKPALSPEARKLLAARLAAVEELKAINGVERGLADHFVTRLASARLYEQSIMARVVSGEPITSSEFKAASDMVEAARSNVPRQQTVKVAIFKSVDAAPDGSGIDGHKACRRCRYELQPGEFLRKCPRCGWSSGADINAPWSSPLAPSPPAPTDGNAAPSTAAAAKPDIAKAKNTPDAPKPVEKRNTKWVGEGDRAFMPAVNFVEGVEGWTKRPSVWPSRGGLRANQPSPPPSQACQNKNHR